MSNRKKTQVKPTNFHLRDVADWVSSEKHGLSCPGATAARLADALSAINDRTPFLEALRLAANAVYSLACADPNEEPDPKLFREFAPADEPKILRALALLLINEADDYDARPF